MASWCRYLHKIFTQKFVTNQKAKVNFSLQTVYLFRFPPKKNGKLETQDLITQQMFGVDVQMYNFH